MTQPERRRIGWSLAALLALGMAAEAGTWRTVFTDDFRRADAAIPGNNWQDPFGAGRITKLRSGMGFQVGAISH
jgi:hypothetical protein